jgi:hypothetical protein
MKKILEDKLAYCLSTRYGVMMAIIQFQNQLEAVESATPRDRIGKGKTSPMTTHLNNGESVIASSGMFQE